MCIVDGQSVAVGIVHKVEPGAYGFNLTCDAEFGCENIDIVSGTCDLLHENDALIGLDVTRYILLVALSQVKSSLCEVALQIRTMRPRWIRRRSQ